jgi:Tol biopolymer transport system component
VRATPGTLVVAALAVLSGCDAERILAFASSAGVGGNGGSGGGSPNDAGASPNDAMGSQGDAGPGTSFGPAQVVTGLRSDNDDVQDPSLTFEELEIYFTSPTGGQNDVWVSRRTVATDPWGPSTLVAELSSPQNDQDPEVSVDGLVMVLASDRGGGGMRLYASQRRTRDTPWGAPALVDTLGSSALDEAPTLDRTQLNLVFASQRGTAAQPHLYAATRPDASAAWQTAVEITALGSTWEDTDPALFADGTGLVFASRRLTQGGTTDLFQATRPGETSPFAALVPMTELNTPATEEDPWLSQNGKHIVFVSDRSGPRRIYEAWR